MERLILAAPRAVFPRNCMMRYRTSQFILLKTRQSPNLTSLGGGSYRVVSLSEIVLSDSASVDRPPTTGNNLQSDEASQHGVPTIEVKYLKTFKVYSYTGESVQTRGHLNFCLPVMRAHSKSRVFAHSHLGVIKLENSTLRRIAEDVHVDAEQSVQEIRERRYRTGMSSI